MKIILFIVIFTFSSILLGNGIFSTVEAEQINVNYDIYKTNPLNIWVFAYPFPPNSGVEQQHTPIFNAHDYSSPIFNFDLSDPRIKQINFCINRPSVSQTKYNCKLYNVIDLQNNARQNGVALVYLTTPCSHDCPIAGLGNTNPNTGSRLKNCGEIWSGCEGLDINPFNR